MIICESYRMYSNANKQDDLATLIALSDNESRIYLDEKLYSGTWLSKPKTLGDVAFIQIFKIIQKKIKEISLGEKVHKNSPLFLLQCEAFVAEILANQIIEKVCRALNCNSNTKRDVAILILLELANSQRVISLISTHEYLKLFIEHAHSLKKYSNFLSI